MPAPQQSTPNLEDQRFGENFGTDCIPSEVLSVPNMPNNPNFKENARHALLFQPDGSHKCHYGQNTRLTYQHYAHGDDRRTA